MGSAARSRGRKGGPPFKMTPIRARAGPVDEHTVQQIADTFEVSRPMIYRHLAEPATGGAAK